MGRGNFIVLFTLGGILPIPVLVGLAGATGAAIGESTGYLAGYGGRTVINRRIKILSRLDHWLSRWGPVTVFTLSLVPFVFVFSPSLLLITDDFNLITLLITLLGAMIGIALIGIAFSGYWFKPLSVLERWITGIVSLFFVAPGIKTMIFGFIVISPIFILQIMNKKIKN